MVLLSAYTALLTAIGTLLYSRFMESVDFGIFTQAFTEIARGNLDPANTLKQGAYLTSHFELAMWLLAPLAWVTPGSIALVWIQTISLGIAGMVVVVWSSRLLERHGIGPKWGAAFVGLLVAVVATNQIIWKTVVEDFHFQPVAALLIVLAARDLLEGRSRRMWIWVGLCLLTGDVAGLYAIGLGVTGLLTASRRRTGALLVVAGGAWMLFIGLLGANHASHLGDYSYLAGVELSPGAGGLLHLAGGLLTHPGRVTSTLWERSGPLLDALRSGGVVGLANPLGLGVPVLVLVSAGLERQIAYVTSGFQLVPAIPVLLVASVSVLLWISKRRILASAARPIAAVVVLALGCWSIVLAISPSTWLLPSSANPTMINQRTAAALSDVLDATPSDAQVIAQIQIVGRFSERSSVEWAFFGSPRRLPIDRPVVVLVIRRPHGAPENPTFSTLRADGARVLVNRGGIEAIEWRPKEGTRSLVVLP